MQLRLRTTVVRIPGHAMGMMMKRGASMHARSLSRRGGFRCTHIATRTFSIRVLASLLSAALLWSLPLPEANGAMSTFSPSIPQAEAAAWNRAQYLRLRGGGIDMPVRSSSSQVAADPLACTALFFLLACLQTVAHFLEVLLIIRWHQGDKNGGGSSDKSGWSVVMKDGKYQAVGMKEKVRGRERGREGRKREKWKGGKGKRETDQGGNRGKDVEKRGGGGEGGREGEGEREREREVNR